MAEKETYSSNHDNSISHNTSQSSHASKSHGTVNSSSSNSINSYKKTDSGSTSNTEQGQVQTEFTPYNENTIHKVNKKYYFNFFFNEFL